MWYITDWNFCIEVRMCVAITQEEVKEGATERLNSQKTHTSRSLAHFRLRHFIHTHSRPGEQVRGRFCNWNANYLEAFWGFSFFLFNLKIQCLNIWFYSWTSGDFWSFVTLVYLRGHSRISTCSCTSPGSQVEPWGYATERRTNSFFLYSLLLTQILCACTCLDRMVVMKTLK